jgi:hypothetical protein
MRPFRALLTGTSWAQYLLGYIVQIERQSCWGVKPTKAKTEVVSFVL